MANLKVSEQAYPSTRYTEAAAPSTPASGEVIVYAKTDGLIYGKDDAGLETSLSNAAAGGGIATDSLWDTAGDLAVGSGANTAAKLVIGNAGAALSRVNGAVAWNSSTSFPTAATGDRFWRTDDALEYYYNGTIWLSTQVFKSVTWSRHSLPAGELRTAISATQDTARAAAPSILSAVGIYLVSTLTTFTVASGGTALAAGHKWVGTMTGFDSTPTSTGVAATITIDSGSSGVWRQLEVAINAAQAANTLWYQWTWTKTGTPGTLLVGDEFYYRLTAT
jgi:hypothetical protein